MGMQDGMDEADPLSLVVIAYITMAVLMVILWLVQRKTKNAAIGDVGWCVGLIASVFLYITQAPAGADHADGDARADVCRSAGVPHLVTTLGRATGG
jgi:hypothetical protein